MFDYESILRTAWVEIDGTRLRDNIRAVQQRVGSSRIIGVAKANAYGHGAKEVAQAYMDCGVDMLAVATLAEAKELRDAGVDCTIVMMGLIPAELARSAERRPADLRAAGGRGILPHRQRGKAEYFSDDHGG